MAREMKNSGVEWLKEIPNSWQITRLGGLYKIRNTKVSDEDFPPLSVTMQGIVPQLDTAAKTNDHNNRKLVKKGDFAINSRSDRRGSCGISEYDGSVSLINTVLEPLNTMNPKYYNWLFHTVQFGDEFYRWGHGIVDDLWTTGWEDMKKITVPVPSLSEQEHIASFLDTKCSEIDALSADIQFEINKLEEYKKSVITEAVTKGLDETVVMKDSGVEWIGTIPKNWTTVRMQDIGTYKKGPFGSAITKQMFIDKSKDTFKVYEQKNAIQKNASIGYYYITKEKYASLKEFTVKPNDIIVSCAGTIGECYILPKNMEPGIINQALMRIRLNSNICLAYFIYVFEIVLAYANTKYSDGSAIKNIPPFSILKKLHIPFPDYNKQQQIASYLDEICHEIDTFIHDKKHQLALLDSYKKSLIYEYVTGKKEVPDNE